MPRAGRLLRQALQDVARETPERQQERISAKAASDQAVREREEKFPFTEETAKDLDYIKAALAWQEQRIAQLLEGA